MNIDTFLKIGKSHKVCEDYILSGTEPISYIILSDGCSSSKQTDMGARLLCFLAQQYIKFRATDESFNPDHNMMGTWIIHNAELVAKQLGLPKNSLDATLIIAYKEAVLNRVRVHFYGDGCVFHFGAKGFIFGEVKYTKNAPYYLSYYIDPERNDLFHDMKQDKIITNHSKLKDCPLMEDSFSLAYDATSVYTYDLNKDYNGLILASDGMMSFIKDRDGIIPIFEFIDEIYSFKTTKGEFLKRRFNKLLKTLAEDNIYNSDDLSVGAFLLEK